MDRDKNEDVKEKNNQMIKINKIKVSKFNKLSIID